MFPIIQGAALVARTPTFGPFSRYSSVLRLECKSRTMASSPHHIKNCERVKILRQGVSEDAKYLRLDQYHFICHAVRAFLDPASGRSQLQEGKRRRAMLLRSFKDSNRLPTGRSLKMYKDEAHLGRCRSTHLVFSQSVLYPSIHNDSIQNHQL